MRLRIIWKAKIQFLGKVNFIGIYNRKHELVLFLISDSDFISTHIHCACAQNCQTLPSGNVGQINKTQYKRRTQSRPQSLSWKYFFFVNILMRYMTDFQTNWRLEGVT